MTTDVEKRMQGVASGDYRPDLLRHILQGQQQVEDKLSALAEVIERIAHKMQDLNSEELEHIEFTVDAFIKRHERSEKEWVITDAPPGGTESLMVDETPVAVENSHEPFKGTEVNPVPLGEKEEGMSLREVAKFRKGVADLQHKRE